PIVSQGGLEFLVELGDGDLVAHRPFLPSDARAHAHAGFAPDSLSPNMLFKIGSQATHASALLLMPEAAAVSAAASAGLSTTGQARHGEGGGGDRSATVRAQ